MHLFRPSQRRTVTFFVLAAMLCAQAALASYVCGGSVAAGTMAAKMSAGEPCDGMDSAAPALCHQRAADTSQSFEAAKVATASLPAIVHELVLPSLREVDLPQGVPASTAPELHPPPDPVFLSTLRLRV